MTPRRRVLVATRSPHKLTEIREILRGAPVEFVSVTDLGLPLLPEEDELEPFDSFARNALSKARYFHSRTGLPTVADDSGLCVDELEGAPGVRTKRFAPRAMAQRLGQDEANNRYLLELLEGVPTERRGARYHCAIAAVTETDSALFEGSVQGSIAKEPRGDAGFGYDPLFLLPGYDKTYGGLPPDVKRRTSHRSRALRKLLPWLEALAFSGSTDP